jgi:transcription termination factor Rho
MTVLERSELKASPLSDLHAIADQLGLDGFRRLRKADLIDAILATAGGESAAEKQPANGEGGTGSRKRRSTRSRRGSSASAEQEPSDAEEKEPAVAAARPTRRARVEREPRAAASAEEEERMAEGVVELLGNGSAFLRVNPPEPSDEDVYISAAQVRRCELASGDRVAGPVRRPRRSERYPSLVRVETINGASASSVAEGPRYEDLAAAYPQQRLDLNPEDPTLKAIEWLTPIGRGSRALIVGGQGAGKTETLARIASALADTDGLELSLVLVGVRPEELTAAQEGQLTPSAAVTFAASAEVQANAVERAIEAAKRVAVRGGDAVVLIDTLDGLPVPAARKALVSARNLSEHGSLTVIATASRPFGGETTMITLDPALTRSGHFPALDLAASATLKPELLVGEDGASAIMQARVAAAEQ